MIHRNVNQSVNWPLTKNQRWYNGEKLVFSTTATGTTGYPLAKKKEEEEEEEEEAEFLLPSQEWTQNYS